MSFSQTRWVRYEYVSPINLLTLQSDDIPHDLDSIRAASHFAHFFVDQARRLNNHKFAQGRAEEEEYLIYNWYLHHHYIFVLTYLTIR